MNYNEALEKYLDTFDFDEEPMTDDEITRIEYAFAAGWQARDELIPTVKPVPKKRSAGRYAYQPESIESLKRKGYGR